MDRAYAVSSPNVSSLISGANIWSRKLSTNINSIYYASMSHHLSPIPFINLLDSIKNLFTILYQFIYPYVMYARLSAAISASLIAVQKLSDISPLFLVGLLQALLPHLFMDIYVNGVNQVFDFEIDKGFGLNLMIGSPALISNILLNFILWTGYSVNVSSFQLHLNFFFLVKICFKTFVLKRPVVFPRSLIVSMLFMAFYSAGIALSKDIPDIEGDKQHGIDSFTMSLGQKKVFWICVFLYEMAFGVVFLAGATSSSPFWIKMVTSVGSFALASIMWYQTKYVDVTNPASTRSFYSLNWKVIILFTILYFNIHIIIQRKQLSN
ncbi:hypothetical protein ACSQ67_015488 [Phaseolus vulgaris]